MKKTRIHGEIRNKFVIKNKNTGCFILESYNLDNEVAVFNSIEEANRYLKENEVTDSELKDIIIENTDISFFDNGAILIEYEDHEKLCPRLTIKDLKEILTTYQSDKEIYIMYNINYGWEASLLCHIYSININVTDTNVYISNALSPAEPNFVDTDKRFTVNSLLNKINELNLADESDVVFEIYTYDLNNQINNQAVSEYCYNITILNNENSLVLECNTSRPLFSPVR